MSIFLESLNQTCHNNISINKKLSHHKQTARQLRTQCPGHVVTP